MQQTLLTIQSNRQLAPGIWEMMLSGDTAAVCAPGQFIDIKLNGFTLRRPISICDWDEGHITLIYKELGKGTTAMTQLPPGETLDVLAGLGNGYDLDKSGANPLLVGGGVGIPPLYGLAKRLVQTGKTVQAVLGFNSGAEIFYAGQFKALGVKTIVTTVDGSAGVRGFVTDGMAAAGEYSYLYTCGPEAMLRAVYQTCRTSGQFSFEERMGCGFGVCMGCSCQTKYGSKRICKDGPVLEKEEILW